MPDYANGAEVNTHYLNKVMDLSDNADVTASEDIFDARGNKLLAKGASVSRKLQEKLVVHKLRKPLESCIVVADGVSEKKAQEVARRLVDTVPTIRQLLSASSDGGAATLRTFAEIQFGSAMGMMLTITERAGDAALDHAVGVSLLSIAVAARSRFTTDDQQVAGLAGLLHDIGELYIDPTYLARGKRLLPHEWAHIVVHPHTGQMLIKGLENCPNSVARAVGEHHERFDGSGYPRRINGAAISAVGQVVGIAETIAGVLSKERPLERAALAFKIIPGEYSKTMLATISHSFGRETELAGGENANVVRAGFEDADRLARRIEDALVTVESLIVRCGSFATRIVPLLHDANARIKNVQRALISTGLDMFRSAVGHPAGLHVSDAPLLFEQELATREIQWRLRDIARDLCLHGGLGGDHLPLRSLINILDDDHSFSAYEANMTHTEDYNARAVA